MKVLHDYDNGHLSRSYAWKRGLELIKYAVSKKLGLGIKSPVMDETDRYLETLIKLDLLCGVEPIIGLHDTIAREKPHLSGVVNRYGVDLREHIHLGANSDPNRRRIWNPPLTQSRGTWHYEEDWMSGKAEKLDPAELPVWHVDYPQNLSKYIDFLYEWRFGGFDPYAGANRGG